MHAPLLSAGGDTSVDRSIDVSSGLEESRALKAQLSARGLSTKGSKSELKARLAAADGGDSPHVTYTCMSHVAESRTDLTRPGRSV